MVQIAGLIARRIVCDCRGGAGRDRRPALRPHPLRQPHRSLSAAATGRRSSSRGSAPSAARRCSPTRARPSRRARARALTCCRPRCCAAAVPPPPHPRAADPRLVAQSADPEHPDPARAVRRHDGDPPGHGRAFRGGGHGDRHRRHARRHRRPHRAAPEGHIELRRAAQFAVRFRQLRRGAGGAALCLDDGRDAERRLGAGAAVRGVLRACAWRASTPRSAPSCRPMPTISSPACRRRRRRGSSWCRCWRRSSSAIAFFRSPMLNGIVLAAVAALMVSRVPTFSLKRFHVPRGMGAADAAGRRPRSPPSSPPSRGRPCSTVGVIYIASMPIGIFYYMRLRRSRRAAEDAGAASERGGGRARLKPERLGQQLVGLSRAAKS